MASLRPDYAFKWASTKETEKEEKMKSFKKKNSIEVEMVESVPGGVRMPVDFPSIAEDVYNFETRPKDVWIVTYPKCGTTWTQVSSNLAYSVHAQQGCKNALPLTSAWLSLLYIYLFAIITPPSN